jgi:riboflavin transporter FmnP
MSNKNMQSSKKNKSNQNNNISGQLNNNTNSFNNNKGSFTITEQIFHRYIQGHYFDFGTIKIPRILFNLPEYLLYGLFLGLLVMHVSNLAKLFVVENQSSRIGEFCSAFLMALYCVHILLKRKKWSYDLLSKKSLFLSIGLAYVFFEILKPIRKWIETVFHLRPNYYDDNIMSYMISFAIGFALFATVTKLISVYFVKKSAS